MASSSEKGYETSFFKKQIVEDTYQCAKCELVLRDPIFVTCCGANYCRSCASEVKKKKGKCVYCEVTEFHRIDSVKVKRELDKKICYCKNKKRGCDREGPLGTLEEHLKSCPYEEIKCIYCSKKFCRKNIESHREQCNDRPFKCPHCGHSSTYQDVTGKHAQECREYPIQCDCNTSLKRGDLQRHKADVCPNHEVECDIDGCNAKILRKDIEKHMKSEAVTHIQLLSQSLKQMKLEKQTENELKILPQSFTVENFVQKKHAQESWQSDIMYTKAKGYALYLSVHPAGHSAARMGGYISVYAYVTQGQFDDQLTWPCRENITVELVNQQGSGDHYSKTTTIFGSRSFDNKHNGWMNFIHIKALEPKYLRDNCLKFRVFL